MKSFILLALLGLSLSLSSQRQAMVTCAKRALGKPYVLNAAGPDKFDCIGLVRFCLKQIGKGSNIGSVCHYQYNKGSHPSKSQLQPGDAVFFKNNGEASKQPGHVGIYIGNDVYINANSVKKKVVSAQLSGNRNYYGATNYID